MRRRGSAHGGEHIGVLATPRWTCWAKGAWFLSPYSILLELSTYVKCTDAAELARCPGED